jgi:hypothetical protein
MAGRLKHWSFIADQSNVLQPNDAMKLNEKEHLHCIEVTHDNMAATKALLTQS